MTAKRKLALIISMVLIISLFSACDKNTNTVSSDNTSSTNSSITLNKAPCRHMKDVSDICHPELYFCTYCQMDKADIGKTIKLAVWEDMNKTEAKVPLSKIKTDIGLKYEQLIIPKAKYVDTLKTLVATGQSPDVFMSDSGEVGFPLTMQIAAPINKVSTVNLEEPIWDQTFLNCATIEGNVYLVNTLNSPWSHSSVLFYHKKLFENNNLKTPLKYYEEGYWSWAALEKALKDVKSIGKEFEGGYIDITTMADSYSASFIKYDTKTATFANGITNPGLFAAYNWYQTIRDQGLANGSIESFKSGKTGIVIADTDGLKASGIFKDMDPESISFTYLPALQDGTKADIASDFVGFGIVKNAPNANAAGYFIRYIADYRNYDLQNAFLTPEAGNFYYELINQPSQEKYFNFDSSLFSVIGETDAYKTMITPSPLWFANIGGNRILNYSDTVNEAVAKGNEIIANLREEAKAFEK